MNMANYFCIVPKPAVCYVPLPPDVAEALRNIPPGPSSHPRYFFWSANGSPSRWLAIGSGVSDASSKSQTAQRRRIAQRCHPAHVGHIRGRDCFLPESRGTGLMLLVIRAWKITEKHYAPWVKARQEQLCGQRPKGLECIDTQPRKTQITAASEKVPDELAV